MADRWVRRPGATVIEGTTMLVCLARDDKSLRFDGDSAAFAGSALEILGAPRSADELRHLLQERAGAEIDPALVAQLVGVLSDAGILVAHEPDALRRIAPTRLLEGARVVLALTGAIACAEAPQTVLALQRRGAIVRVALSRAARRFVSTRTLEALTHAPAPWQMTSRDPRVPVPHIELAQWADAMLIAPASATTISRIARGDCSDLISAIAIATTAPVLVAPSMNERMLEAPSTRRNLEQLIEDGLFVVRPVRGIEVADRPGARGLHAGVAPGAEALARSFEAWFAHFAKPRTPRIDWDALYRSTPSDELPWIAAGLDDVVEGMLREHAPAPGRLLDVGCGLGSQAREAARLGYAVVALDASGEAIRAAAQGAPRDILFVRDDITQAKIAGTFDVILDRGTFHGLAPLERASYARHITQLAGVGAVLCVIHDGPDADPRYATHRLTPRAIEETFPDFRIIAQSPATLRRGEAMKARATLLRKVGERARPLPLPTRRA